MELAQEERAAQLQRAVINGTIQEIVEVYDALGYVEMSSTVGSGQSVGGKRCDF